MKVRVKFAKYGCMKFIGHLDVMRFFQKAIRRAGIDVAYSTGYSPHQIMSFASPLGVGMYSNGEYMDIEVKNSAENALKPQMSSAEMCRRLNEVSVPGIEILSVKALPENAAMPWPVWRLPDILYTLRILRLISISLIPVWRTFLPSQPLWLPRKQKKEPLRWI